MKTETFANYILDEDKNMEEKMAIMCYLEKKLKDNPEKHIYFDKGVILKTALTKMFIETMDLDIDENLIIAASLLCNCKKGQEPQKIGKVKTYAKEGAEYLETLGFDKKFCKMCEELNRYSGSNPREKESDILEVVDQFGGLLLDRPERSGYAPMDALVQIEHANLKDVFNRYLGSFRDFVERMENINILVEESNMRVNALKALARKVNTFTEKKMDQKNLLPLIEEIAPIVRKTNIAVKEQKKQNKQEKTPNKAIFAEGALERAEKISREVGQTHQTVKKEGRELGE